MPRTLTVNILCPKCGSLIGQQQLAADIYHQTYTALTPPDFRLCCSGCGGSFLLRECKTSEVKHE